MTQNRRSKRATRERTAQTGEKYTDARFAPPAVMAMVPAASLTRHSHRS